LIEEELADADLAEFFSLCADMLAVTGRDLVLTLTNPALRDTLAVPADLDSACFLDLVHEDDRSATAERLASIAPGTAGRFANRCRARDGGDLLVDWRARRHPDSGNIYLVGTDTSGEQLAKRFLHDLSSRHAAILAAIPDIVAEVDARKVYVWMNPAGLEFFGDDAIGKDASSFIEGSAEFEYRAVQPLFEGSEETIFLESWQRRKDGERRLLAWWCRALKDEAGQVVGALSTARDVTARRSMEEALRESEQTAHAFFENAAQGIVSIDIAGRILSINTMAAKLFGYEKEELAGKPIESLLPESLAGTHRTHRNGYFEQPHSRPMGLGVDLAARRKDGSTFPVEVSLSHISTKSGPVAVAFVNDITERKRAEHERERLERGLEHATKMEAVGRLAGGIAHDFNNLLTALSGFAEIVLDELPETHPLYEGARETFKTCQRSTSLVRRLLALSRRQVLQPEVLDLNAKVSEVEKMLKSVLGEDIELTARLDPELGFAKLDHSQIEQVILNLVVNARDAMPGGGAITISTANVDIDAAHSDRLVALKPGPYVLMSVSDTGHGMSKETLEHIFEPFFTTKEKGKGTGLGLASVYGIVNQSDGYIWAYSEPGQGATFEIYLPRVDRGGSREGATAPPARERKGSETVLVVEDENTVRLVAAGNLRRAGYLVLAAADADEALRIAAAHPDPIHLILTDVLMPRMNGPALVTRIKQTRPAIRTLFMSGHADDALLHHGVVEEGAYFLEKPFTRDQLTRRVREALDSK
jgi:PAS domain S-box-containing protein